MNATVHALPHLSRQNGSTEVLPGVTGDSPPMKALASVVRKLALTSLPVLIRGESGSGKELVAAAIHQLGKRRANPYVAINSATVTNELGASQLFGHVPGAFTGANSARAGAFREADGGTLFLDELGALPLESQTKLLRVLEEQRVTPVGTDRSIGVDVRIIAATCDPLTDLVGAGRFRADLYERLAVIVLEVPPLRARREDIPALATALLAKSEFSNLRLSPEAFAELREGDYRGNVRELRNVLMHAALLTESHSIGPKETRQALEARPRRSEAQRDQPLSPQSARELLKECDGNITRAANRASLARSTFRDLLSRGETAAKSQPSDLAAPSLHSARIAKPSSLRSRA